MYRKIIFSVAWCLWVAGCAHTPTTSPAPTNQTATAKSSTSTGCAPETATRLPQRPDQCAAASFGHSWTQDDLKRVGTIDVASGLQLIDPIIQAHH
jgi:hypothetical protein